MRSALLITAFIASSAMADHATTTGDAMAMSTTPEECAAKCSSAHDACVTKPDANMAECASEFAACLGYNPYDNADGFIQPTACSSSKETPPSPSSSSASAPWHTKAPSHHHEHKEDDGGEDESNNKDECRCYDEYNRCRAAPGANMSFCASNYAECLGYNPFDGSHDPEEVSSKCSSSSNNKGGDDWKGEEEAGDHKPHRNETRPVQPTQPPVISGAAAGVKALDVFGLLAAGIAALV